VQVLRGGGRGLGKRIIKKRASYKGVTSNRQVKEGPVRFVNNGRKGTAERKKEMMKKRDIGRGIIRVTITLKPIYVKKWESTKKNCKGQGVGSTSRGLAHNSRNTRDHMHFLARTSVKSNPSTGRKGVCSLGSERKRKIADGERIAWQGKLDY